MKPSTLIRSSLLCLGICSFVAGCGDDGKNKAVTKADYEAAIADMKLPRLQKTGVPLTSSRGWIVCGP